MIVTSSDGIVGNPCIAHYYKKLHPRIIRDNKILKFCVHANIKNNLVNKQQTGVFWENPEAPAEVVFVGLLMKQASVSVINSDQPFYLST